MDDNETISRRTYLLIRACEGGATTFEAVEAVSSTAIAHPEWDMAERRTWSEWSRDGAGEVNESEVNQSESVTDSTNREASQ